MAVQVTWHRRGTWLVVALFGCAAPQSQPLLAFVVSGRAEQEQCFMQDRDAAAGALTASSVRRFAVGDAAELPSSIEQVKAPLFLYYAGHGSKGLHGQTLGASAWDLDPQGSTEPLPMASLLAKVQAPWVVVLSATCYSAWSDVSKSRVPAAVISTGQDVTYGGVAETNSCAGVSPLGRAVASALAGGADTNLDCLVTDEELAAFVQQATQDWPEAKRPELRVSRNRSRQLPIARVVRRECERNLERILQYASALPEPLAEALRDQVSLARGTSSKLPVGPDYYYIAATADSRLQAAAARSVLPPFPGDLATARQVAKLASFTEIVELEVVARGLRSTNLATGKEHFVPLGSNDDLSHAVPSCGSVEGVGSDRLYVHFRGQVPAGEVSVRQVPFRVHHADPIYCSEDHLSGNCFQIPMKLGRPVYPGDPIHCSGGER